MMTFLISEYIESPKKNQIIQDKIFLYLLLYFPIIFEHLKLDNFYIIGPNLKQIESR